jgi:DNA gyrase/topoisomerase IV subunit A
MIPDASRCKSDQLQNEKIQTENKILKNKIRELEKIIKQQNYNTKLRDERSKAIVEFTRKRHKKHHL